MCYFVDDLLFFNVLMLVFTKSRLTEIQRITVGKVKSKHDYYGNDYVSIGHAVNLLLSIEAVSVFVTIQKCIE